MRLMHVFRIIRCALLLITGLGYANAGAQSAEVKTERLKVRVLDIAGLPVSISKADTAYIDGQRVLNYTLINRGEEFVPSVQWLICYYNFAGKGQCLNGGQAIANLRPGMSVDKSRPLHYEKSWLRTYGVPPGADLFVLLTDVEWEQGKWKAIHDQLVRAIKAFGARETVVMPEVLWQVK